MNNTPRNLDDFDASEWGNVQLPGISDEELHAKNWNKSRKGIISYDENWKQAQQSGASKNAKENIIWYEKTNERNKKMGKDPIRIKKIKESKQRIANDPIKSKELSKKLSKNRSKKVTTPLGIFDSLTLAAQAHGIAMNTLRGYINQNKQGYSMENDSKGGKTTAKPIMTPTGVFPSKTAAANWALLNGLVNANKKIHRYLKEFPNQFYYISKEEYILLTGKEI